MSGLPPIYFGPITKQPSWKWVGADIAEYLNPSLKIKCFENLDQISDGALVFWIKCPGDKVITNKIKDKGLIVIFFPVDAFLNQSDILAHTEFIDYARLICLHAHSLAQFFPLNKVEFIDHYNKYGVRFTDRRPDNKTLLWIGGFQYAPYVLHALDEIDWPKRQILLLTNHHYGPAKVAADKNAAAAGLRDYLAALSSSGMIIANWSEASQREALLTCAAAFDFKYLACFNQLHKPPTKLQKYLASGIPCAANGNWPAIQQLEGVQEISQLRVKSLPFDGATHSSAYRELLLQSLGIEAVAQKYIKLAMMALSPAGNRVHAFRKEASWRSLP